MVLSRRILLGVVEDGSEERTRPNEEGCGGNRWSLSKGYIGNGECWIGNVIVSCPVREVDLIQRADLGNLWRLGDMRREQKRTMKAIPAIIDTPAWCMALPLVFSFLLFPSCRDWQRKQSVTLPLLSSLQRFLLLFLSPILFVWPNGSTRAPTPCLNA